VSIHEADPLLSLLPVAHPPAFDRLSFEEQRWRGRLFLMTYTYSGSVPFSWWSALRQDSGDLELRAFLASVDDAEIAFRVAEAAQGRWYGPPETEP
jgi:hypothetical protein